MRTFFSYIVYGFVWLLSLMPFRVLYILSDFNYLILAHVIRYRRRVIDINLKNSFPEKSDEERAAIRKAYYHHLCDYFIETFKLLNVSEESILKRCVYENPEVLTDFFDEGKSVVGIMGHYCNWEWMVSFPLIDSKSTFLPIYKHLHNKVMDKLFYNIRARFGAKPVAKKDVLRRMVEARRDGKITFTGFVGDQTPTKSNIHYWTNFLNQETPIFLGVEKIARKFNQPVVFVNMNKVKRGHYEVSLELLCENPKDLNEFEITEMHTRFLEKVIQENPAYWLWSHKRWKHKREV